MAFTMSTVEKIQALANRLNFAVRTEHGCRRFGPNRHLRFLQPERGSEVFVGRLPINIFEDEIYPFFAQVGDIFKIKLMLKLDSTTKGYCFVEYFDSKTAKKAVEKLNGAIFHGVPLFVEPSTDHRILMLQGVTATTREIEVGVNAIVQGLSEVSMDDSSTTPIFLLKFSEHRFAHLAMKRLAPEVQEMWGVFASLDWQPNVDVRIREERKLNKCLQRISRYPYQLEVNTDHVAVASWRNQSSPDSALGSDGSSNKNSPPSTSTAAAAQQSASQGVDFTPDGLLAVQQNLFPAFGNSDDTVPLQSNNADTIWSYDPKGLLGVQQNLFPAFGNSDDTVPLPSNTADKIWSYDPKWNHASDLNPKPVILPPVNLLHVSPPASYSQSEQYQPWLGQPCTSYPMASSSDAGPLNTGLGFKDLNASTHRNFQKNSQEDTKPKEPQMISFVETAKNVPPRYISEGAIYKGGKILYRVGPPAPDSCAIIPGDELIAEASRLQKIAVDETKDRSVNIANAVCENMKQQINGAEMYILDHFMQVFKNKIFSPDEGVEKEVQEERARASKTTQSARADNDEPSYLRIAPGYSIISKKAIDAGKQPLTKSHGGAGKRLYNR